MRAAGRARHATRQGEGTGKGFDEADFAVKIAMAGLPFRSTSALPIVEYGHVRVRWRSPR